MWSVWQTAQAGVLEAELPIGSSSSILYITLKIPLTLPPWYQYVSLPGSYVRLILRFLVQRGILSYLVQIYWPTVLITTGSWITFWMNYKFSVTRVTVGRYYPPQPPVPERHLDHLTQKKVESKRRVLGIVCDCTGKETRWVLPNRHLYRYLANPQQGDQHWRQVWKKSGLRSSYVGPKVQEFIIFWIHEWMGKS